MFYLGVFFVSEVLQLRELKIIPNYLKHAEGSVLIEIGNTKVLCSASVIDGVPRFLRDRPNQGWLTAEYSMLPRATHQRSDREAVRGKQSGRTLEIQRLIGRSLRSCINLNKLGPYTIHIDCDVIQADGSTRTAAITGGCVALVQALQKMQYQKKINHDPIKYLVAAVSVGICNGKVTLDLDYKLDSQADTDMNIVMNQAGDFIEVQGTAEKKPFSHQQFLAMLTAAEVGLKQIFLKQQESLCTDPLAYHV